MKIETVAAFFQWPIVECGTYDGGSCCPDLLYPADEAEWYWDERQEFVAWGWFDMDRFCETIAKQIQDLFDEYKPLEKWGVKVVKVGIDSPREYNFRNDWAALTVEVPDDFIQKAIDYVESDPDRMKTAEKWIDDHRWKGYDGWFSCMPSTWEVMKNWAKDKVDTDLIVGGLLGILTKIDEPERYVNPTWYGNHFTNELVEHLRDNYSLEEFYPTYRPNELLRKYGIDEELRVDEKKSLTKIEDKMDTAVRMYLDDLAYHDQKGDKEQVEHDKSHLFEALRRATIKKLQEMK